MADGYRVGQYKRNSAGSGDDRHYVIRTYGNIRGLDQGKEILEDMAFLRMAGNRPEITRRGFLLLQNWYDRESGMIRNGNEK